MSADTQRDIGDPFPLVPLEKTKIGWKPNPMPFEPISEPRTSG